MSLLLSSVLTVVAALPTEPLDAPNRLAIVGAHVIPVSTDGVLRDRTVLVEDGIITAVGPADEVEVPDGFARVDAAGAFLTPGLSEMHGHLPSTPGVQAEDVLFLYVANGVTHVRGMLGSPGQLTLRDRLAADELWGPRLHVGSPPLSGGSVTSAEQAESLVRSFHAAGYDHLKVHEGLSAASFRAIAETAEELGLRFGGHVSDVVGLSLAQDLGQDTVDHLDNFVRSLVPGADDTSLGLVTVANDADPERIPELVTRAQQTDTVVVPTMALWRTFFGGVDGDTLAERLDEVRYMPASTVSGWRTQVNGQAQAIAQAGDAGAKVLDLRDRVLAALHEGGVRVLLGTDSPQLFSVPGFSIHREMAHLVDIGFDEADVLRAGTLAVAEHYGETDTAGSVDVGRRADLVLLDANPLDDIDNMREVAGVVVRGRWLPREVIDERLAAIEERCRGS